MAPSHMTTYLIPLLLLVAAVAAGLILRALIRQHESVSATDKR